MRKCIIIINIWRLFIALLLIYSLDKEYRKKIFKEVLYWGKINHINKRKNGTLFHLLLWGQAYRNLLYYRIGIKSKIKKYIFKFFFPIMNTLFINVDELGDCLYIQHGFATIITAKK